MRKIVYIKPNGRERFIALGRGSTIGQYYLTKTKGDAQLFKAENAEKIKAWFDGLGIVCRLTPYE